MLNNEAENTKSRLRPITGGNLLIILTFLTKAISALSKILLLPRGEDTEGESKGSEVSLA